MAKVSLSLGITVNNIAEEIQFSKISISIDDLDLELPVEEQLKSFDEVVSFAKEKIRKSLLKTKSKGTEDK